MADSNDDAFSILLSNCNQIDTSIEQLLEATLTTSISQQLKQISNLNEQNRSLITNVNKKQQPQLDQVLFNLEESLKQQISIGFSQAAAQLCHVTTIKTDTTRTTISHHNSIHRTTTPNFTEIKDAEFDTMLDEIVDNNNNENYNSDNGGNNDKIDDILQSVLHRATIMSKYDKNVNVKNSLNTDTNKNFEKIISNINGSNLKEEKLDEFDFGTSSTVRAAVAQISADNEHDTKLQDTTTATTATTDKNKGKNIIKISKKHSQNTSTNILKFASKLFTNYSKELATACVRNDTATARKILTGKYNIDINYTVGGNSYKITPLHAVCEYGNLEIFQLLMKHKPKLNILDAQGNTPLFSCLSSQFNYTIFTRLAMLAPDSEFHLITKSGLNMLMLAAGTLKSIENNSENINVLQLIERRCNRSFGFGYINKLSGKTALMYAFEKNYDNLEICKYILDRTPSEIIDIENIAGETAFMIACEHSNLISIVSQMAEYGNKNNQDYGHLLPINGFKRASHGWTSLFYACKNNNYKAVEILCKRKDLDIDLFVFNDRKRRITTSVIEVCVEKGSDECLSLVLETLKSVDHNQGTTKLNDIIDLQCGFTGARNTALCLACAEGNVACVSILLKYGACVNIRTEDGDEVTPMMAVLMHSESIPAKNVLEIIIQLLNHMDNLADIVNICTKDNIHALGFAVAVNLVDVARIFCQKLSEIDGIDMVDILTKKLGKPDDKDARSILDYCKEQNDAMSKFINGLYAAYETKDSVKVRSMLTALTKNQERSLEQYWKFRKQDRFCGLFLDQLKETVDTDSYHNVMNQITHVVCDIFARKLPISDDMMMLVWKYCETQNKRQVMFELIDKVIRHSLSHENPCKTRDYLWFKKYLLNSNIWYQSMDSDKSLLVYDMILESVDKQLNEQRLYLAQAIDKMKNESSIEASEWNNICSFKEYGIGNNLRQDNYKCNQPRYNSNELRLSNDTTFDSHKEYETKVFLTNLLITARTLNTAFQSDMKQFIKKINPNAIFQSGSPKLMDRCLIKSQTVS